MRPLERITTWLCFLAALFMGVSPAQSFVLCLEPDGCVSLELQLAGEDCSDCEVHAEEATCSCVDVPVPGVAKDTIVVAKRIERASAPALAPCPEPRGALLVAPIATARPLPRPPDSLSLIRSVVLLS